MRSIILANIVAAFGLVMGSTGIANAQLAFEWSPQNTKTHLTGTLVFVPTDGNGDYFQCKVALDFETGNIKKGADKPPIITSGIIKGKGCGSVKFLYLDWLVGANDMQEGSLSPFGWNAGIESCVDPNGAPFNILPDGRWYFDGFGNGCLTGYLTPNPPVSVVAVP